MKLIVSRFQVIGDRDAVLARDLSNNLPPVRFEYYVGSEWVGVPQGLTDLHHDLSNSLQLDPGPNKRSGEAKLHKIAETQASPVPIRTKFVLTLLNLGLRTKSNNEYAYHQSLPIAYLLLDHAQVLADSGDFGVRSGP